MTILIKSVEDITTGFDSWKKLLTTKKNKTVSKPLLEIINKLWKEKRKRQENAGKTDLLQSTSE